MAQLCFGQTREAIEATQVGNLELFYIEQDEHFANAVKRLPDIRSALEDLTVKVSAARAARADQLSNCARALDEASRRAAQAMRSEGFGPGVVADLLSDGAADPSKLTKATSVCTSDLSAATGDNSSIAAAVTRLDRCSSTRPSP